MVNQILDAISKAIGNEFGSEYEIYLEPINQGLQEPCFIVACIVNKNKLFRGKRYLKKQQFSINYLSEKNSLSEFNDVSERLFECLEYINDGDLIRGENMSSEVIDNMLVFSVDYDFFVKKSEDKDSMGTHSLKTDIKD